MFFFFQAEDGIRYLVRSRGLGDVYKRQASVRLQPQQARRDQASRGPRSRDRCRGGRGPLSLSLIQI